ncbi:MAG TPA: hypothetical protein VF209_01570 [Patescibacteria group bacterium]
MSAEQFRTHLLIHHSGKFDYQRADEKTIAHFLANFLAGNGTTILRPLSEDPQWREREIQSRKRYVEALDFNSFEDLFEAYLVLINELRLELDEKSWNRYFNGYGLSYD